LSDKGKSLKSVFAIFKSGPTDLNWHLSLSKKITTLKHTTWLIFLTNLLDTYEELHFWGQSIVTKQNRLPELPVNTPALRPAQRAQRAILFFRGPLPFPRDSSDNDRSAKRTQIVVTHKILVGYSFFSFFSPRSMVLVGIRFTVLPYTPYNLICRSQNLP
jgi:hypothetical protein